MITELKEQALKIKSLLDLTDFKELPECLMDIMLLHPERIPELKEICNATNNILQHLYQFYLSKDEKVLGQDFTPETIAQLMADLVIREDTKTVYDMCAGSGALSLACLRRNPNITLYCDEMDQDVIPFLLWNLMTSGASAYVRQCDVLLNSSLTPDIRAAYRVAAGHVTKIDEIPFNGKFDVCISNPPYNINGHDKQLANLQFAREGIRNANYEAILLPGNVSMSRREEGQRLQMLPFLHAVISLPGNTFESTSVSTVLLLFGQPQDTARMINAEPLFVPTVREQRGEGGAAHYNRIYRKTIMAIPQEGIDDVCRAVGSNEDEVGISATAEHAKMGSDWNVHSYITEELKPAYHRNIAEIVADVNRIARAKASIRVTINEKAARDLDIPKEMGEKADFKDVNDYLTKNGYPTVESIDFCTFTKSAEIVFRTKTNKGVTSMLQFWIREWAMRIHELDEVENVYLAELRNALISDIFDSQIGNSNSK